MSEAIIDGDIKDLKCMRRAVVLADLMEELSFLDLMTPERFCVLDYYYEKERKSVGGLK